MGAYQIKITIKGSKPPIWRRLVIPSGITFEMLHQVIQTAFCWSDSHLYEFEFRTKGIRVCDDRMEEGIFESNEVSGAAVIDELMADAKKFTYTYDFGDNWEHVIEVEKVLEDDKAPYARVVKYKGGVIPEDCGGIMGYYDLLYGPDYQEWAEEQGIQEYDLESVNERLKALVSPENAVFTPECPALAEIFDFYDKESIIELAKRHHMSGYSKLKKRELAQKTAEYITNTEVMERYFLCARDCEIWLFEEILAGRGQIPAFENDNMDYLFAGGYVTAGERLNLYFVAEEVKQAYQIINTEEFQKRRSRMSLVMDYLCAANALYAVTPITVALDLFNTYEAEKLTETELYQVYEALSLYRPLVKLIDGRFVDCVLAEQNAFQELYQMQKDRPYYMPTAQEIRFMADNGGFLMNRELEQFGKLLIEDFGIADKEIPYILREVASAVSVGTDLQTIVNSLEVYGIIFQDEKKLEPFVKKLMDVWNHSRMVLNRGYAPCEMNENASLVFAEKPRNHVQKIYPNDPCPCGSGKKYKKCCGKNR